MTFQPIEAEYWSFPTAYRIHVAAETMAEWAAVVLVTGVEFLVFPSPYFLNPHISVFLLNFLFFF